MSYSRSVLNFVSNYEPRLSLFHNFSFLRRTKISFFYSRVKRHVCFAVPQNSIVKRYLLYPFVGQRCVRKYRDDGGRVAGHDHTRGCLILPRPPALDYINYFVSVKPAFYDPFVLKNHPHRGSVRGSRRSPIYLPLLSLFFSEEDLLLRCNIVRGTIVDSLWCTWIISSVVRRTLLTENALPPRW